MGLNRDYPFKLTYFTDKKHALNMLSNLTSSHSKFVSETRLGFRYHSLNNFYFVVLCVPIPDAVAISSLSALSNSLVCDALLTKIRKLKC